MASQRTTSHWSEPRNGCSKDVYSWRQGIFILSNSLNLDLRRSRYPPRWISPMPSNKDPIPSALCNWKACAAFSCFTPHHLTFRFWISHCHFKTIAWAPLHSIFPWTWLTFLHWQDNLPSSFIRYHYSTHALLCVTYMYHYYVGKWFLTLLIFRGRFNV